MEEKERQDDREKRGEIREGEDRGDFFLFPDFLTEGEIDDAGDLHEEDASEEEERGHVDVSAEYEKHAREYGERGGRRADAHGMRMACDREGFFPADV